MSLNDELKAAKKRMLAQQGQKRFTLCAARIAGKDQSVEFLQLPLRFRLEVEDGINLIAGCVEAALDQAAVHDIELLSEGRVRRRGPIDRDAEDEFNGGLELRCCQRPCFATREVLQLGIT